MASPMMTSTRPRDVGGSFASRRGHGTQLSISDPSHHVTETIGTMYGEDEDSGAEDNNHRPLSFIAAGYGGEHLDQAQRLDDAAENRLRLVRTTSDETSPATQGTVETNGINGGIKKSHTFPAKMATERSSSKDGPKSPLPPLNTASSTRDAQSTAPTSKFPLRNIDNPNDIAMELSNLQALRRMSMDVGNTTDPDLLQFSGVSLMEMPPIAPTGDDDEADPSRLLWVPARVHPELEPTAFKNFLEKRVQTMKRRSGDSLLSVDGLERSNSSGLRRKKSMLSRQVNPSSANGEGYVDGADKLARQRSIAEYPPSPELSLSELVNDPTKAVQKLSHDAGGEADSPIIPMAPGMGLRRSTKTTYRKTGSQRYGDRAPFSKRVGARQDADEPPPVPPIDPSIGKPLTRVQSEPVAENYSRPTRTVRRQQNFSRESNAIDPASDGSTKDEVTDPAPTSPPSKRTLPDRSSSTSTTRTPVPPVPPVPAIPPVPPVPSVPQIIETPPAEDTPQPAPTLSERSSSQKTSTEPHPDQPPVDGPPARSSKRPAPAKPPQPTQPAPAVPVAQASSIKEPAPSEKPLAEISHPQSLPGSAGSTTSSLTFIPTFDSAEKKVDRKSKEKDKDDSASVASHKSTSSWKWFKSDDKEKKKREKEKEKGREREREREREELARQVKAKAADKGHDSARLDVIQSSIDNVPKGRESLRLDRDSLDAVPHEERKKETNRKSSEGKKDREGFFGGLFGGSKKKSDKDSSHKKKDHRPLTPEPPPRILQPDVDYAWTRFPIIEERAIYRMAHIKLANPRRSLHSQVLLSNFMYSYLAKVQAMHPQLQIPVSPQQKRLEEERKRKEAEQALLEQQLAQQAAQDAGFSFEYHRSGNPQYGDAQQHDGSVQYVDDAQIYEYEHGNDHHQQHAQDGYAQDQGQGQGQGHARQASGGGAGSGGAQNHYYAQQPDKKRFDLSDEDDDNNDMW